MVILQVYKSHNNPIELTATDGEIKRSRTLKAGRALVPRRTQMLFDDISGLWNEMQRVTSAWSGKTTIVGGHYMLAYRQQQNTLVPLMEGIAQRDPQASTFERNNVQHMGNFPEETFEIALRLLSEHTKDTRRIALVVNDVHFRRNQPDAPLGEAMAQLRRGYYRSNRPPEPYLALMKRHPNLSSDQIFERYFDNRGPGSLIPNDSIFFSERVLQKDFDDRLPDLLKMPGFRKTKGMSCGWSVTYEHHAGNRQLLADEDVGCGCSGETLALLMGLAERGTQNFVFMIPDECQVMVEAAISIAMKQLPIENIVAIWGEFGGALRSGATYRRTSNHQDDQ